MRETLGAVDAFASEKFFLELKRPVEIGRSASGMTFCGYRILPGALRLSRRRRRRYADRRSWWENAYSKGVIDERALQMGYDSVLAITAHAEAAAWRREQLRRRPIAGELLSI